MILIHEIARRRSDLVFLHFLLMLFEKLSFKVVYSTASSVLAADGEMVRVDKKLVVLNGNLVVSVCFLWEVVEESLQMFHFSFGCFQ